MKLQIRSRKIIITPLERDCLEALEAGEADAALKACEAAISIENAAHLENVIAERPLELDFDEEDIRWNTLWVGVSRETGAVVGTVRMLGRPTLARELTLAAFPASSWSDPLFARMFSRIGEWCFSHRNVYYLCVDAKDEAAEEFLRQYGFLYNPQNGCLERERTASSWILSCICFGLATGVALGETFGSMSAGMAIGGLFGVAVGITLDTRDKSRRKNNGGNLPKD